MHQVSLILVDLVLKLDYGQLSSHDLVQQSSSQRSVVHLALLSVAGLSAASPHRAAFGVFLPVFLAEKAFAVRRRQP
jgi:hypothetical protein